MKNKNLKIAGVLVIGTLLCTAGGIAAYTSDADEGAETAVNYATYLKAGGAAVRLKDINAESIHNGIRFISLIDADKYAELEALEKNDTDTVKVDYGMTIVPYDYVAKYGELNKENLFGENAKYYIDGITEKEEGKTMLGGCIYETLPAAKNPVDKAINLSIVNLPEKQLVREFIGVAFIRIATNNVAEYYVGGYTQEEARSMAYVTQAALNDKNSTLTEDQKSFLQTNYLDDDNVKDKEYTYSTEHILVDLSGKETLKETVTGEKMKIGATVTATPNSYEWYEYDEDSSVNTGIVYANNRTVLKLYYKEKLSTLSLGEGVVTADGKAEYAKDSVVTLKHTGTVPQGTVFDGFKVDGEKIAGETFTINKTSHVIEAVYATAETMTWGTSFTDASTLLPSAQVGFLSSNNITAFTAGTSKNWALSFDVTGGFNADEKTNQKFGVSIYFGNTRTFEFQVNGSAGNYTGNFKHYGNGNYNQIGQLSGTLVQKIVNASEENPVHFDAVRLGDYMYVYVNGEYFYTVTIPGLTMYGDYFGYAWRVESKDVTTQPQIKNAKAVVGEERATLAFERFSPLADITFENEVTAEKESYRIGETVKLIAPAAPEGQKFLHFTVDGKRIDGNTFVAKLSVHQVKAVYVEITELVLGEGVSTTDGKTTYARGERVRFTFDSSKLNGKVVDYYVVDKDTTNQKIYSGDFVLTAASHTVEAVLVNPSEMTWGNGGTAYNYENVMGTGASEWKTRGLDGEVYGQAEYWAISVDAKYGSGWQSFEFIQGTKESIRIRVEGSGWCGILLMQGKESEQTPSSEFIIAYDTSNPLVSKNYLVVNQLKAGATVTCVRNGSVISMYIGGVKFFETSYAVDHTGDWFGVGHVDGNFANAKPEMSNTKFITGKEKVEEYLKTLQSDITWEQGGEAYTNLAERMGDDATEWTTNRDIDGEVYGQAEYWAVSVDVKSGSEWQSFEFIQGSKESIRLRFHSGGFFGVIRMKTKAEKDEGISNADLYPTGDFTAAHPTKNETVVNKLKAGTTITCVRYGNTIAMYADGVKFFQTAYAVDHTGNWFGVGHVEDESASKPEMSNTKFITGQANVGAYLSSLTAKK